MSGYKAAAKDVTALSVHTRIEEAMFYPAVKTALKDELMVAEANVEPDGEMYDAQVKVL